MAPITLPPEISGSPPGAADSPSKVRKNRWPSASASVNILVGRRNCAAVCAFACAILMGAVLGVVHLQEIDQRAGRLCDRDRHVPAVLARLRLRRTGSAPRLLQGDRHPMRKRRRRPGRGLLVRHEMASLCEGLSAGTQPTKLP